MEEGRSATKAGGVELFLNFLHLLVLDLPGCLLSFISFASYLARIPVLTVLSQQANCSLMDPAIFTEQPLAEALTGQAG